MCLRELIASRKRVGLVYGNRSAAGCDVTESKNPGLKLACGRIDFKTLVSRGWLAATLMLLSGSFRLAVVFRVDLGCVWVALSSVLVLALQS